MMRDFTLQDMRPLDALVTHQQIDFELWPPWQPVEYALDRAIRAKALDRYPGGDTHGNHCRAFVGFDTGVPIVFEWTYPRARFVVAEEWMVRQPYAKVFRYQHAQVNQEDAFKYFAEHEGTRYDWLQLAGIALGWRWLQLGDGREVCSSGLREAQEALFGVERLFSESETWQTLPCAWCNHAPDWEFMNNRTGGRVLIREGPKARQLHQWKLAT